MGNPCIIEIVSSYAGTSEEVRLRGQIFESCGNASCRCVGRGCGVVIVSWEGWGGRSERGVSFDACFWYVRGIHCALLLCCVFGDEKKY